MRFAIALAALLSGASSSSIGDFEAAISGDLKKIDAFRGVLASSPSSRNSKKGQSFVRSSSNDYKSNKRPTFESIAHLLRSRESPNSRIDEEHYKENDKALMVDGTSPAGSRKFEVCEDLGVMKSCSSKGDICVPLTEHQLSILSDETEMDTYLTEEEKGEMSICLDLSSIEVLNLLTTDGDASAAVVTDGKGAISEQRADDVPKNGEDGSRRYLQSTDCATYCASFGLPPTITQSGEAFQELIADCIADSSTCPGQPENIPINCWSVSAVTDMAYAFDRQYSFNDPLECWDTSAVTNTKGMFYYATKFNQPIQSWDVSNVEDMYLMFGTSGEEISVQYSSMEFNQPVDSWDVSKVTDMHAMFYYSEFNQPVESWVTSKVTDMAFMFGSALQFDQPVNQLDTSKVDFMAGMFYEAYAFNQPVESLDTSQVIDMSQMFEKAYAFNQPVESWVTSKVKNMSYMFQNANNFDQPVESWDVSKVTDMHEMFYYAQTFNQCLSTWVEKTGAVYTNGMFYGSGCPSQSDPDSNEGPWCQDSNLCPSEPKGPCTNSNETFKIGKKTTTCNALDSKKKSKQKKLCKKSAALEACPAICNTKCTCEDKKKFKIKGKKFKCKKVNKKGQPECSDFVNKKNKVSDFCPNKCDACY